MKAIAPTRAATIGLIGNPNTGKSTLFQALSGVRQRTGNYPGVTVEKKIALLEHAGHQLTLVDLPGTYSLAPRSPEEMVAVDVLLGRNQEVGQIEVVICVLDASNLERNLFLFSQILGMGLKIILALNMVDVADQHGCKIDVPLLEKRLGVPVVPIQANRKRGVEQLLKVVLACLADENHPNSTPSFDTPSDELNSDPSQVSRKIFPAAFNREVDQLLAGLKSTASTDHPMPRYLVERLLLDAGGYLQDRLLTPEHPARQELLAARARLDHAGCKIPAVEALSRYRWIGELVNGVIDRPAVRPKRFTDRLDTVLTHRVFGLLFLLGAMFVVFEALFSWSEFPTSLIEQATSWCGERIGAALPEGVLKSLVVDGLIAGVGGVIVFLPQIMLLFLFIALLEDVGYMARAAYLMDKLMLRVGLSGKSFIPLLSSFACAVPGIMATRVIEDRRDRLTTILVAPLMSCSARLPVYVLMANAFLPDQQTFFGIVNVRSAAMVSMYVLGVLVAAAVALVLKRSVFRGPTPPFVMELPSYKIPSIRIVLTRVWESCVAFLRRAGTLIVAVSIVVWAATYFPHDEGAAAQAIHESLVPLQSELESLPAESERAEELSAEISQLIDNEMKRQSYLGQFGKGIEPAITPLGWDWRIGCAVLASFPAREVVVSTLGIIYNVRADDEETAGLSQALKAATWHGTDNPVFTIPVALSLMVFFSLCAQCASTLVIIRKETGHWGWALLTFVYMTLFAYLGALVTYQVGNSLGW